mgnify:CR=1 FL=1
MIARDEPTCQSYALTVGVPVSSTNRHSCDTTLFFTSRAMPGGRVSTLAQASLLVARRSNRTEPFPVTCTQNVVFALVNAVRNAVVSVPIIRPPSVIPQPERAAFDTVPRLRASAFRQAQGLQCPLQASPFWPCHRVAASRWPALALDSHP